MSITIPAAVAVIRNGVFDNCHGLKKLIFLGDAPKEGCEIFFTTPLTQSIANPKQRAGVILLQEGQ
jgi:hypothetical protein